MLNELHRSSWELPFWCLERSLSLRLLQETPPSKRKSNIKLKKKKTKNKLIRQDLNREGLHASGAEKMERSGSDWPAIGNCPSRNLGSQWTNGIWKRNWETFGEKKSSCLSEDGNRNPSSWWRFFVPKLSKYFIFQRREFGARIVIGHPFHF